MKRMKVWFWVALLLVGGVDANAQVPACKADLDGNGVVDFADFLIFAQHYGKTNLVSCQPDTVEKVVRDTIYIDGGSGGDPVTPTDSLSIPRGLAHLVVSPFKIPTGISIWVSYHDEYGKSIQGVDEIWRNPDKITVTVNRDNRELYRSTGLSYQRNLVGGTIQHGINLLIPKSEIPAIYADWSSSYTIRVVVEFDGQEYSN